VRKPDRSFFVRVDFSTKRWLIQLNRDLDTVKLAIRNNHLDDLFWKHSMLARDTDLVPVVLCVLALEDRRFFRHSGIEIVRSTLRSIKRTASGKRIGGISTIDQQVVRIARRRYERTIPRKMTEVTLAYILNLHVTKSAILQYYLHNSYFGYRLEGCEIAANTLFAKSAANLDFTEASIIAAALARPIPKAIVVAMNSLPPDERTAEILLSHAHVMHPGYALKLEARANFCQGLLTESFISRLIK
jgi:membrane peptidoglycan carboxypeptidase